MTKRKRPVGRPRKFRNGDIIKNEDGTLGVVVQHRLRQTKSEYNVIPLTKGYRRYGVSSWKLSNIITNTGRRSSTGSLVTYRANLWLDEQLPEGRGCLCHCCVHEAMPRKSFSRHTGAMKDEDYE